MFTLASNQALTSRIMPESGLAGRIGDKTGARGEPCSTSIGTSGTAGASSRFCASSVEGAVRGRRREFFRCISFESSSFFSVWRDATLRRCRRSHFFAVSCLLLAVVIVCSVVGAVMMRDYRGAAARMSYGD